ncbi:hypothetical protein [Streptomyces sp. NPDC005573]|uniref:hypothetical protein n=1 Tax=Streptomyces sp. NPDC005573 TaxID=3156890 RepID=UPI0033BB26D8
MTDQQTRTEPTEGTGAGQSLTEEQPRVTGQSGFTEQSGATERSGVSGERPAPARPTSPAVPAPRPGKDRRVLRAALRWTAAVAVFAVTGAGTAYGITRMNRTDVPGLATASDGRWAYPELVKPPLPAGSPGPLAAANKAGAHYADLRALLLPAPEGATADRTLKGDDGWLRTGDFLAQYAGSGRKDMGQSLTDNGLRHIAARGWTAQDGTRTRIYLLQFGTAAVAENLLNVELEQYAGPVHPVRGASSYELDGGFPPASRIPDVTLVPYAEVKPYGKEQIRLAYVSAGDTLAMIVQSRAGSAAAVPFRQTVTLQSELLA